MKKIISILLALSMLFSLNTVAFAAESGTTDELQIVEENGTRTVSLNDGELTYIVTYGPYLLGKLTNRCPAVGVSPQPVGN